MPMYAERLLGKESKINRWCRDYGRRPSFITSVHISFTFSKIMLQCLSNAFTLPRSFLLFLQLISTCSRRSRQDETCFSL